MSVPVLNVLMPVYNGEQYLHESVESILSQTFSDFELFVIDDGSTDQTFEILASFAERDKRVHLLQNETNLGIVHSMNKLFKLVRAPYIVRHDADDISMPDRFEQQLTFLIAHPEVGLVSSQVEIIDGSGNHLDLVFFSGPLDNDTLQHELLSRCPLCQTSVMFRSQLLGTVGLYDENLEPAEDYDLWLRMAEVTHLARLPLSLCKYRYHLTSVSRSRYNTHALQTARVLDSAIQRRFGVHAISTQWEFVAQAYLTAAIVNALAIEWDIARLALSRALAFESNLFATPDYFEKLLVDCTQQESMEFRPIFYTEVFNKLLDGIPQATRWRSHILSRLRLSEVFAGARLDDWARANNNLWLGLWQDPKWLLNRGVLNIALKVFYWRVGQLAVNTFKRWQA